MLRRISLGRLLVAALLLASVAFFVGCGALGGDQNTFAPKGDVAERQRDLFLLVLWPAIIILALVTGALVYALVRFRRRRADEAAPKQVHGNTSLEIAWTVLPMALLLGLAVPTVMGIVDLGREPGEDALQVRVVGRQFFWTFEYAEFTDAEGNPLESERELHVPVGREIGVSIESQDVIHSFWVPKLAGKQDAIPGRTNKMWFEADVPGTYSGQCAEFCGLNHAFMRLNVIAQTEEEFQDWVAEQLTEQNAKLAAGATEG